MSKTVSDYTKDIVRAHGEYDRQAAMAWDWKFATCDPPYQIGSIANISLQLDSVRFREKNADQALKGNIAGELSDVLAEVFSIAHGFSIDLDVAFGRLLQSDREKIAERSTTL